MSDLLHIPVLLTEATYGLHLSPGMVVVDGTFGGGGHSAVIAGIVGLSGKVYAFDQDENAAEYGKAALDKYDNIELINENFKNVSTALAERSVTAIDAAIFDLGVSSFQIDDPGRGFSWKNDCALDMRMSNRNKVSAQDVLNLYTEEELARIIKEYGEERHATKVASRIIQMREQQKITKSHQLRDLVFRAVPGSYQNKTSAVSRVFQAIRIEVNQELTILPKAIEAVIDLLKPGGRIAVITFHSLEDRIIKNLFKHLALENNKISIVTKKPIITDWNECKKNVRARSAKLRIAEKLGA